jgi:hypothetical protein
MIAKPDYKLYYWVPETLPPRINWVPESFDYVGRKNMSDMEKYRHNFMKISINCRVDLSGGGRLMLESECAL